MTFETSKVIDRWIAQHRKVCSKHTTGGEQFIFEFLPNGIVECQTVRCMFCEQSKTDYVD